MVLDFGQNDLRVKMQNMHDKLKASSQLGYTLNGDNDNDPSSFKILDHELSSFDAHAYNNQSSYQQSEKIIKQVSSKISYDQTILANKPYQKQFDQNQFYEHKQDILLNLDSQSPKQIMSNNMISSFNDGILTPKTQTVVQTQLLPIQFNKNSDSSDDSSQSQTHQQIEVNNSAISKIQVKKQQTVLKSERSMGQGIKLFSIFQDNLKDTKSLSKKYTEQSQSRGLCNRFINFLRQQKKQSNFDKGLHIIERAVRNQMNTASRVEQKVLQFIQVLKSRYIKRNACDLNEVDIQQIGDLSYYYINHQQNNSKMKSNTLFQIVFAKIFKIHDKIFHCLKEQIIPVKVFMPTDILIIIWDILQIVLTYTFLFLYSTQVFFAQDQIIIEYMVNYFKLILSLVLVDVVKNCNTSYFEKDQIIQTRSKIALKYFTSSVFFTDMISLSVIFIKLKYRNGEVSYNPDHRIFLYIENCLIFLLVNRLYEKRKRLNSIITLEESQKHIFWLFIQLFNVISVAHFASIAWHSLGIYEETKGYQITWLSKAGIIDYPYFDRYIYSIYWTVTTMTTVGYGDISATNPTEALFISISMILFSCVFAYSINNIGFILSEIEKSSKKLNENITIIQRKNVDISLKTRVRFYLNFLEQESKNRDKKAEDKIIELLSKKLKNEITEEINTKILKKFYLFSSNFSSKIMKKMVFIMDEVLVSPNEIIFQEGDTEDQSIYFIQNGIIEIYSNKIISKEGQNQVYQKLSTNQLFGEISFFSGLARKASARSVNLSTMYRIKRDKFIELLKTSDEDFERLKMMQEQIIFDQSLKCLYLQCYSCKQLGHIASQCNKTHTHFDQQFIVLQNNFSTFQERSQIFKRSKLKNLFKSIQLTKKNKHICKILKDRCKNANSATILLYGESSDDEEKTQTNDQDSILSSEDEEEESSKYIFEKPHINKGQSSAFTIEKDQQFKKRVTKHQTQPVDQQNNPSENQQKNCHIKSSPLLNDQNLIYQNNCDDLGLNNNHSPRIDKQRLSELEAMTSSAKNLAYLQQIIYQGQNSIGNELRTSEKLVENMLYQQQKQDLQELKRNNSIRNIENDATLPFIVQFGKKKSVDAQSGNVGIIQQEQKNLLKYIKDQQKTKDTLELDTEVQLSHNSKVKKRLLFLLKQNTISQDGQSSNSNTSIQAAEQWEKNEEIPIRNKQPSNKINPPETLDKKPSLRQSSLNQLQLQKNKSTTTQIAISDKTINFKSKNLLTNTEQENNLKQSQQQFEAQENDQDNQNYLEDFDKMHLFKRFFPHNNIDKILTSIKSYQKQNRKKKQIWQQKRRRSHVILKFDATNQIVSNSPTHKQNVLSFTSQKPSYLSYGVSIKNQNEFPKQKY